MSEAKDKSFQQCVLDYERCLISPGTTDLMKATFTMLDGVSKACSQGGFIEKGVAAVHREHWYTRAASGLSRFIIDPQTRVKGSELSAVAQRKQAVVYIFAASGFRNMSHLVELLKDISPDGNETMNLARAAVLLSFIGLDDVPDGLMDVALRQHPDVLYHLTLGWLNQRAILTAQGEKNRERLLAAGDLLMSATITDQEIMALASAWMYCSYASSPNKHDIKVCFNHLLSKRMTEAGIAPTRVTHSVKQRPKLMVIHERFMEQHAMFRCYAPMMRSLKAHFETVALADATMIDQASNAIFDRVLALPTPLPAVNDLVALIQSEKPDVIYYPSIGMSPWTIMLAGLRLAPLQVITQGHPATTKLDTIDYVYVHELAGDLSQVYAERVIVYPPKLTFERHSGLPDDLPALLPPSSREVNIAVNSKVMKLSWRLLTVCRRLEREASVPIKFTFFPGERFLYGDGLEAAIQSQLPTATVVPYCNYDEFLKRMCKADFALAAFPFGNTNSTVDTCLLGLPTVVHFGLECPAQTDALVLRSAGLAEWLICDTDEAYFQAALRLANEPDLRAQAMGGQTRGTIRDRLLNNSQGLMKEPFGETLFNLHRNYSSLRNVQKRVFDYTEIIDLQA